MKIAKVFMLGVLLLGVNMNAGKLKSKYDFETTLGNVKSEIEKLQINIFAEYKHSDNAEKAGVKLNPTSVIVFGNPKVGTTLMQENQKIAIELPLRMNIYQNDKNEVFVNFIELGEIAKKYKIKNTQTITKMSNMLESIAKKASGN
ncbi:hypothetical protein CQA53_07025 [Helicobacter didelphidarum]|uniref:DUF302 domain-containing protein n=1 Tax=Helicobacter didelphidarum TaxID=2040648 RepID=A0A3D8II23_9HELI|nr:DUF302 domain-containing protein [Helicobacter didelphidarum]RDU64987.1 hypothetical protein CQA53_07025 [Helicobacter didelphidarum]